MKKIGFVIIAFLNIQFSNGQQLEELKLTSKGVAPTIITLENLNSKEAYDKALAWIENVYDKPKEVLKENNPNSHLLIMAYKKKAWWYKSMGVRHYNDMLYEVDITFEKDLIKFDYQIGQFYLEDDYKVPYDFKMFFKKDGSVRPQYDDAVSSLEASMNNLLHSFYSYVTGVKLVAEENVKTYTTPTQKSYIDDLKELAELKEKGVITEKEFNELKAAIIACVKKQ